MMANLRRSILFVCLAAGVCSGASFFPAQSPPRGVPSEWEIREDLKLLVRHIDELGSALLEVHPELWVGDGPKEAYQQQLQSIRDEAGYARRAAEALAARPERLTLALETHLRLDAVGEMLISLCEGVRRYQSEPAATRIQNQWSAGARARDKLREYMVSLAEEMESQSQVMAEEAQRCREQLSRQPAPPANKKEPQ
jgi:hypothetical protein